MQQLSNFIGGELVAPHSGAYLDDFEPATGRVYARLPESDAVDLEAAVAAAERAWPAWSAAPAAERARWLDALADRVEAQAETLARAEAIDTGKPIALARAVDIPRASANLRFFAAAATQFASESHAMQPAAINYTLRQPLGVVACISPWNLPLYLLTWKIAPALAAGNTVVAKPSEVTPMTAWLLAQLCRDVGLPPGVLNILHGSGPGIGAALVEHPAIKAISFTGGTRTGAAIAAAAAPQFKKVSLELGGKNPNIVFADCDWERAMTASLRAGFSNQGQICLCGSRLLIERSIYDRFATEFCRRAAALRIGDPLEEGTEQGAVVSEAHMEKILSAIRRARDEGGQVRTGGERVRIDSERCASGWFVAPTVIDGLAPSAAANQEEIFGPVVTLWSADGSRCHRLAERLAAGLIWVNCWMLRDLRVPFGGMKSSGVGREGGFEAMRFFTEAKNVCIQYRE